MGFVQTCSDLDAASSLCIHRSICPMGMPIPSWEAGGGAGGAVLICKEQSLVPSPGAQDPRPGMLRKSGISFPFEKHLLGTYCVQGQD